MTKKIYLPAIIIAIAILTACSTRVDVPYIAEKEQQFIIEKATESLDSLPITVTANVCERSEGGKHDFYSEGDYWWPDPENPDGPYIRRDGETNPDNFYAHRWSLIRLSRLVGIQISAFLLTGDQKYANSVNSHLKAWFTNEDTKMNPSLLYVQAIKGRVSGRGIGIIDAIHFIEVARSIEILEQSNVLDKKDIDGYKAWFAELVEWLTTHPYGIEEMNWKNNHSVCWTMQVGAFARLTGNSEVMEFCRERFKTFLLPRQMGEDGSFPLELERTKPYGYSLFNLDAFMTCAEILSDENNNLFEFTTSKGQNMRIGAEFLFPFVKDKSKWTYPPDVMYWEEWPVRHPFLLFAGRAFNNQEYIELWKGLDAYPETGEVLRNLPIRNPLLWLLDTPVQ